MKGWDGALLVIALVAPLIALAVPLVLDVPMARGARLGAGTALAGFALLLIGGRAPSVAGFEPDPLGLAAAAGAMLVVIGLGRDHQAPGALAAVAVAVGACASTGATMPRAGGALLGAAAAIALAAPVTEAGVALVAAGAVVVAAAGGVALVLGFPVAIAAAGRRSAAVSVALPGLLLAGLRAVPAERLSSGATVALAALATVIVLVPFRAPARDVRTLSAVPVALWAMVAVAGAIPGTQGAGVLLACAAVVVCVVDLPAGLVAALPGAVALGHALLDAQGRTAAALAVLAVVTAVALALDRSRSFAAPEARVLAGVLAVWLALRPSAWGLGATFDLGHYESGAAIAAAAAAAVAVAGVAAGWVVVPDRPPPRRTPPVSGTIRARSALFAATAAMGLIAGALLRSSSL